MKDVYCSTKFKELQVHVQSKLVYNCCKAYPERIDLKWLEENPGKLFNTPTMVRDRELMLSGQRCVSCDWGCYKYEDQGLQSSRKDHNDRDTMNATADIETLKISLSTDCNLTCAYCSAEWSTAWNNDLSKHGDYEIQGYSNKKYNWNDLWKKLKQKDRSTHTKFFHLLNREIHLSPTIKQIRILGGEPLLHNKLCEMLDGVKDKKIVIATGLGIAENRLEKLIPQFKNLKDISFMVSAESTGRLFEFIRHGCSWDNFRNNLEKLLHNRFKIRFGSVVSNLSSFGLIDFYKTYASIAEIGYNPVTDRPFMDINVLDDQSKSNFEKMAPKNDFFNRIRQSMWLPYEIKQKEDLKVFLSQFSKRRDIDLNGVFPDHFLKWVGVI